jgi:anti-sigma regulatory factor (Ser/Thr protein kinase)
MSVSSDIPPGRGVGLRLAPTPRAPSEARAVVDRLAPPLRPEELAAVRLLVSELVTNSVRHAGLDRKDWIDLHVAVAPHAVRVTVTDPGGGFTPPRPPGPTDPSGWGLTLVERMANRWGISSDGSTQVWFELRRAS